MEYRLSNIIPVDFLPEYLKESFNKVYVTNQDFYLSGFVGGGSILLTLSYRNENNQVLSFNVITEDQLKIEITNLVNFKFNFTENLSFSLSVGTFKIYLPTIFKPLDDNNIVIPNQRQTIQIPNSQALKIDWNVENGFEVKTITDSPVTLSIGPTMIGETGIIFQINQLSFDVFNDDFQIFIREGILELPKNIIDFPLPDLNFTNCSITKNGFTGELKFDWDLSFDEDRKTYKMNDSEIKLFGEFTGGLDFFAVTFENNAIKACNITGEMLIPYFEGNRDATVRIAITINDTGDFAITAKSATGTDIKLTKEDLIQFHVQSLELYKKDNVAGITISGGLEPLLYSSQGMKWPRMDVKNLKIDSTGKFSIDEAWLDLKDLATLDLFGFKLELRKIGLGTATENNTDKLWIDLSGGLKLIDQIPLGVDVEGFRILWPHNKNIEEFTPNDIGIQFKGVQFSFGVPNAIQIDGLIRFFKDAQTVGFAGDMVLVIPPAGITAEAGLLVGMNNEQPNPYPFFYVYFGLEAAAGIPLGQSGLALKGAMGLFGINVAPNRKEGENWYHDWYKKSPAPGAHQTTKWTNERDALAVGAGVTITTVDGIVKGTKGIVVLALPGPILVINGKALIFDGLNPNPNAEPPFSATAIFDGKEKIVQFNIEAQAEIVEDMVDAYAGVEAFFDFKDATNWHLYLGEDQPDSRRIRANILNIIEANAYLMLDMIDSNSPRTRMGVDVSIKPKIDDICFDIPLVGEQCIRFDAHLNIGGDGMVSVQPEQFSGKGYIDAGIEIKVPGIELIEIGADVDISIEGPSPFSLQGNLELYANLPDPLPDYEDDFYFELKIPKVEIKVKDPLTEVSLFSRFTSESKRSKIYDAKLTDNQLNNKDENGDFIVPLVECDSNPILSFEHQMNQNYNFLQAPAGLKKFDVGVISFTPTLKTIVIKEKEKKAGSNWKTIYTTDESEQLPLIGTWLVESDPMSPSSPASRRLQLMTFNPLSNTMYSTGMSGHLMMQSEAEPNHLSETLIENYPDIICTNNEIQKYCVDFNFSGKPIVSNEIKWSHLFFSSYDLITISKDCLYTDYHLKISFPETVYHVEIECCSKNEKIDFEAFEYLNTKEIIKLTKKTKESYSAKNNYFKKSIFKVIKTGNNNSYKITSTKGFDYLELFTKDKSGINIKAICYITTNARIDFEINKKRCESNKKLFELGPTLTYYGDIFTENQLFKPGRYYEIEIKSKLEGEVIANRIEEKNNMIKNFIIDKYDDALESIPNLTSKFAYFQTEAPPQNLEPYIKWSLPTNQENYVYKQDPINIRFKRGYLNILYDNSFIEDYQLKIYLKGSDGIPQRINNGIAWLSSKSATLFPDEETWTNYLRANNLTPPTKKDDILSINLNSTNNYKENSKYEILLIGIKRLDIASEAQAKNAQVVKINNSYYNLLASRTFITSKFSSLTEMMKSSDQVSKIDTLNNVPIVKFKTEKKSSTNRMINFNFSSLITNEINYYKAQIDYEFGILRLQKNDINLLSKEALEESKIRLRIEKDKLDDAFNEYAMLINSDVFFQREKSKVVVHTLGSTQTKVAYIWLKLPEKISLKYNNTAIGNIEALLTKRNNQNRIDKRFKYSFICNSDTTQIIFKLLQPIRYSDLKNISIRLTKIKDFKDDVNIDLFGRNKNVHHRFDRPSQKSSNNEVIEVGFDV